ncbi:class I SAM-dependent methyltransferase [Bittarella massiliensis (ex Durand et al. 2017)]|uniref:class I SAM-dependent methyltransferase n=1 Tax=Bittarella massiliensis (ex Durand et al. 2017) TaxID=1720313 RepID=UPI001AA1B9CE|nr:class I SAM-dependent methyltransferase [Bittarella massiliensis (ex Durand et al. 2017)]MBO1680449.1 SAM-dependent methyltransferase [Bittarella massiliensis (ex Durand et al. 2017)]
MIRLPDKRLQAVAALVPSGTAADIGCDHGYLICHLVESGRVTKGYACDISEPSLQKARRLAERNGLAVSCICTDGLQGVPETDTVIAAGMGGELIASIILADERLRAPGKTLVLQPMSRAGQLRIDLYKAGFELVKEQVVCDRGRVYTVMLAAYAGEPKRISPLMSLVGLIPLSAGEERALYYEKVLGQLYSQKQGLMAQGKDAAHIEELIVEIKKLY